MRSAIFIGWVLLLGLTLVYGGLVAAEKGVHDLMAWHRPLGAMSLQPAGEGSLKITFAGRTRTINLQRLVEIIKERWRRHKEEHAVP